MTYELIDYVGDRRMVLNSIKIATENLIHGRGKLLLGY